jgi:hypothetical protein
MPYAAFLTHDWGENGSNHERVARVYRALINAGLAVWFDEVEMRGDVRMRMADGVEASDVIVVFITKRYCEKVSGRGANGLDDHCKFEFDAALQRKGVGRIVVVVMEERARRPHLWGALVSGTLGNKLYVDLSNEDDESFARGVQELVDAIASARAEPLREGVEPHPQPADPSPMPIASLDVDEACELLAHMRVQNTEAFRREQVHGSDLALVTDAALRELGVATQLRRDAVLAELRMFVQQGVPAARMGMIRATLARRAEDERHEREDELRAAERAEALEWLHSQGLGSDLLTASYVNLEKRGLIDGHMAGVALLLKVNTSLNRLDLDNNTIGDAGIVLLAPLFKSMASLKTLWLSCNKIGDAGAAALAPAFKSMASLNVLRLDHNQIGDAGAAALAPAFKSMASLNRLDLDNNQIGNKGAAALAPAFKSMASLEKLYLYDNKIGDSGAAALAQAFPSMVSLEILSLYNNKIGDSGAVALATALPSMASLKTLYLSSNKMGSPVKNAIRSAFKNAYL